MQRFQVVEATGIDSQQMFAFVNLVLVFKFQFRMTPKKPLNNMYLNLALYSRNFTSSHHNSRASMISILQVILEEIRA